MLSAFFPFSFSLQVLVTTPCFCGTVPIRRSCAEMRALSADDLRALRSCGNHCSHRMSCGHRCSRGCHDGAHSSGDSCQKKVFLIERKKKRETKKESKEREREMGRASE